MDFPELLTHHLSAAKLSQVAFARAVGVTGSFVNMVCRRKGKARPALEALERWADALGLNGSERSAFIDAGVVFWLPQKALKMTDNMRTQWENRKREARSWVKVLTDEQLETLPPGDQAWVRIVRDSAEYDKADLREKVDKIRSFLESTQRKAAAPPADPMAKMLDLLERIEARLDANDQVHERIESELTRLAREVPAAHRSGDGHRGRRQAGG
jgi:transcriptional regulator with XRE-family HTH domain